MLYSKTVEHSTLGLIQKLQQKPYMQNFILVGGTALALQFGHRTSTDIDLFVNSPFDTIILRNELEADFFCEVKSVYRFAVFLFIENVKVDIVYQKSIMLNPPVTIKGIKMASLQDLAAMKLMAITNRGKLRDFVDIYILLKKFALNEMLEMWAAKYDNQNYALVLRSLTYFEDAVTESQLKWFFPFDWTDIQLTIIKAVRTIKP